LNEDIAIYPVADDFSEVLYVGTQSNCNLGKIKIFLSLHVDVVESEEDDEIFGGRNMGEYKTDEHNKVVAEELELIKKIKRQI
jgi:hypothetical protein